MKVSARAERSVLSVLELFKFITSLALVTAVATWLGFPNDDTSASAWLSLEESTPFIAFLLLLVRFYHGNSLHLLDKYSVGTPAQNLGIRLPADLLFVLSEGILFTILSFFVNNIDVFSWILLILFLTDSVWLAFNLTQGKTEKYKQIWFAVNVGAFVLFGIYRVWGWESLSDLHESVLMVVVMIHTILDYSIAWSWYFPVNPERTVMIGAPFTKKLDGGVWKDKEMKDVIWKSMALLELNDYDVYSAHQIEEYGKKLRKPDDYVVKDIERATSTTWYIGITDGTESDGLAVEFGAAASHGANLILFTRHEGLGTGFIESLVKSYGGTVLTYASSDDLVNQLASKIGLSKRDRFPVSATPPEHVLHDSHHRKGI